MTTKKWLLAVLLLAMSAWSYADSPFDIEFDEIADDVWVGIRPDGPRFPVMGNAMFVVGESGVVVYDGGGMPTVSDQIIEKIRAVTDRPVTDVVISHWHGDHFFGVHRFAEEFDNVNFIAHEFTRDMINSSRINYVDRELGFMARNSERYQQIVDTGVDADGNEYGKVDREVYQRIIDDADVIEAEFLQARVTPPNIVMSDEHTIDLGDRIVELKFLGHGNTAGDIVMWLPDERIVATGDIVVLPSPYAFNVPPRAWADTLRAINALDYATLVPGHGAVQSSTEFVDLIIESAESIADQRDAMLAESKSNEEIEASLDFSLFEERYTHGDEYVAAHFDIWFEQPLRLAAMKALTGEPMVQIPSAESVPFNDERWHIDGEEQEIVEYLGQTALRVKGGSALLPELDIKNGLIEFDVAITEQRGFAGLVFRMQDNSNYENFYIRPHQSGNPDANQYQPVFNGVASWQLYHGEDYATPVNYRYNEWMKVKIVYAGTQADIYIDSDEPVLHVDNLRHGEVSGAIGLNSANFSAVHFANFRYTQLAEAYEFPPAPKAAAADNVITAWEVSDAFDVSMLESVTQLTDAHTADRTWLGLESEPTGITNLAQVQGLDENSNTAFAMVKLSADEAQIKELTFGYSDSAAVYLNGTLIYKGDNTYRTRDYRYLGTIGMFDKVILPLQVGENELCIAVTEGFGGWGVMGKLTDF